MTGAMVGLLIFLAAANPAHSVAAPSPAPVAPATAQATARIRIISGVKFGPDYTQIPPNALRRSGRLIDYDGQIRSAELLEFQ